MLAGAGLVALMDDTPAGSAPRTSFLLPADSPADQTQVVSQHLHAALVPMLLLHCPLQFRVEWG